MVYKAICHAEKLVHNLPCQDHSEGLHNQNRAIFFFFTILSKLLVCLQPHLSDSTALKAGLLCGKMGLLRSRSRSQRRFRMLVKVCPDNIFWTTGHFVAKPCMVMQHHKPSVVHKNYCVQCQGHSEGLYNQNVALSVVSSKLLVSLQPSLVW